MYTVLLTLCHLFILIFAAMISIRYLKITPNSIKLAILFNKASNTYKDEELSNVCLMVNRQPTVSLLLQRFQIDVGMIIILYLFEIDSLHRT